MNILSFTLSFWNLNSFACVEGPKKINIELLSVTYIKKVFLFSLFLLIVYRFLLGKEDTNIRLGFDCDEQRKLDGTIYEQYRQLYGSHISNEDMGRFSYLASYMVMNETSVNELNERLRLKGMLLSVENSRRKNKNPKIPNKIVIYIIDNIMWHGSIDLRPKFFGKTINRDTL